MADDRTGSFNPPSLSAPELHEILLTTHAAGNASRRRFCDALRALEDTKLYLQLGYPSLAAYAEGTFRYGRSQTYTFVRVSRALEDLPLLAQAYERGATSETQAEWLRYRDGRPTRAVLSREGTWSY